ncbi:AfsR/SARP family transcriptional regulator [Kibdelosporangium aridum]|uniref:AfsR/SARP family transcriptional regulator n=1 Tax=Kibdelosporangium aridum TaxID=2030 RepID=A0A428XX74_KIBAR|nr:AfsR/SARP family transcriptional regulator [Kibdelosporangium aridum]RSM59925.1 AfsR/SARP family transcriptional regulator [Kibdelosporangium aridum]
MLGGLDIRVLGPVELIGPQGRVALCGGGERTLLARLGLSVGQAVARAALIDALWPDAAPATAVKTLRSHLARLRGRLREAGLADLIATRGGDYALHAPRDAVDAARFETLTTSGRAVLASGDAQAAVEALRTGLALWHGEALADCRPGPWQHAEATRLGEARLAATEDLLTAQLALGGHATAIGELKFLVSQHPFRERLWELLMLALYRSGRQADALTAFQRARTTLIDELGIEPGRELRRLEAAILTADSALELPPHPDQTMPRASGPAVPRQLPADNSGFIGRHRHLQELDALLPRNGDGGDPFPQAVVISAIAGTAGIGKTTLALHWAHQIANRYPDGQLYVNLRGFDPQAPMETGQALHDFLRALGMDPQIIPTTDEAKASLYRGLLADRRMLIVLDNARDTDHVRPLLPASPTCLVIITSRNRLDSLTARDGAHRLILDLLTTDEAVALLATRLGHQRVAAEPDAVADLIDRCARLPLALSIAAARATTHPHLPLSRLVDDLADERTRLDTLDLGDTDLDLRTVFSWSYHTLTPQAARLFRLLGVHPGPDISLYAAANLTSLHISQARSLLNELTRAHLLEEHASNRYRFHDLLRTYAIEQATDDEPEPQRRAAMRRVLDYYVHTSYAAALVLAPHWEPIPLDTPQTALTAARRLGDRVAQACAHRLLGSAYTRLGRNDALDLQRALTLCRELGDRTGQARIHHALGWVREQQGRHDEALTHAQHALDLFHATGHRAGEARALNQVGWCHARLEHYPQALTHCQHALHLLRDLGDRTGEALALDSLGYAHHRLGHHLQAITHYQLSLALWRHLGSQYEEAQALHHLGDTFHATGNHPDAQDAWQHALAILDRLGHSDAAQIRTKLTLSA